MAPVPKRKTKTEYFLQEKPKEYKGWCYEHGPFETLDQIKSKIESDERAMPGLYTTARDAWDHRIVKRTTKIMNEEIIVGFSARTVRKFLRKE